MNQRDLIDNTLRNHSATVEVRFEVNGVSHILKRESESEKVYIKLGDGDFEERSQEEIRKLLPIQAYSQKQLSRVGQQVNELNQFIRSGIKTKLAAITSQIDSMESEIRQIYATVRRKHTIERSIQKEALLLASLMQQAETIRESLIGLTEEQQNLIAKQPLYMKASLLVDGWKEEAKSVSENIRNLIDLVNSFPSNIDEALRELPEIDVIENIIKSIDSERNSLQRILREAEFTIKKIVSDSGEFEGETGVLYQQWISVHDLPPKIVPLQMRVFHASCLANTLGGW